MQNCGQAARPQNHCNICSANFSSNNWPKINFNDLKSNKVEANGIFLTTIFGFYLILQQQQKTKTAQISIWHFHNGYGLLPYRTGFSLSTVLLFLSLSNFSLIPNGGMPQDIARRSALKSSNMKLNFIPHHKKPGQCLSLNVFLISFYLLLAHIDTH